MNKIAELVKEAEVRGVLAALVDGGHLKVASQEEFDALTEVVAGSIDGYDHDLNTVLSKTAEVIEYLENGDFEKEAGEEEIDQTALMAAFGELTMMKMAGQIDDETFEKEAASIKGLMEGGKAIARKAWDGFKNTATATQFRGARKQEAMAKSLAKVKKNKVMRDTGKSPKFLNNADMKDVNALEAAAAEARRAKLIGAAKTTGLYGAGAAGTAVGSKALYDKYKK